MKIYYLGKFWPRWRTERYVNYALSKHRCHVARREFVGGMTFKYLTADIQRVKPDVVLFSKASAPCFDDLIIWCRNRGIVTAAWIWDLYWGYRSSRLPQFKVDRLFTTDGGHDKQWIKYGANHVLLRQGIHEPEYKLLKADPDNEIYDVAFFGHGDGYRSKWIRALETQAGIKVKRFTDRRGMELNKTLAQCKIVLGDSYPSENYWSNRVYEMLGRGAFLLHPKTVGLDSEFTAGTHYVEFERGKYKIQLPELIRYYLDNPIERERIKIQGFDKMKEYTYTRRVGKMLRYLR